MNRDNKQHGFTLIELMLAMSFVSLLLIAIAMTVIQIGNIYNRGITLKDVNQAGRSLTSELQRSINQTAPFSITDRYVKQDWGGRLCLGQYSYIWNYGKDIQTGDVLRLNVYDSVDSGQIRFVKVLDPNTSYCTKALTGKEYKDVIFSDAVELLNVGQHNLAIHSFAISAPATAGDSKTGQQLYSIEFLIGTNNQAALMYDSANSAACLPPDSKDADPLYCSINQFNIVVRAGNTIE